MGMNFSPMYQPVSTKTIKADGDLNVNPYDLLATDVKCDTVEASEFVGGVGNFTTIYGNLISNAQLSTTPNGDIVASFAEFGKPNEQYTAYQSGIEIGQIPFPTNVGLLKIGEQTSNVDITFTLHVRSSGYASTGTILRNGVEYSTITVNSGSTGSKVISIPYGDKSVWGCKYKSGELLGTNGYGLTVNQTNFYLAE